MFRVNFVLICTTEECLIDFRELVGEHSGENMANQVWESFCTYGIEEHMSLHNIPSFLQIAEQV